MQISDEEYNFIKFYEDLKNGFQIYYTYMGCRYLIYKLNKNCYRNDLIEAPPKCPHRKMEMFSLKRVQELFPFMEDLEYKVFE
jgi:hypothetical protein